MWLVGVVVRRYYRFPHITYPYSSCICSFLQQHPFFLFILKNEQREVGYGYHMYALCCSSLLIEYTGSIIYTVLRCVRKIALYSVLYTHSIGSHP